MPKKTVSHFAFVHDAAVSEIGAGLAFLVKKKTRGRRNG